MLEKKSFQANSLDTISSHLLQTQSMGTILRTYQHMVTIQTKDGDHLHIVNPTLGNGPRRILLDPYPDEVFITLYPGMRVTFNPKYLHIDQTFIIQLQDAYLWTMPIVEKVELLRSNILSYLQVCFQKIQFNDVLIDEHALTKQKIQQFFLKPSFANIASVLGLGSGSTPIGDDALCGYILSQRFLGRSPTLIHQLATEHFFQTTSVSQEMLNDVYHGFYSEVFIDWFKQLIHHPKLGIDEDILKLGGKSGAMILLSFYQFTIASLKEEPYEHVFAYSR